MKKISSKARGLYCVARTY